MKTFFSLLLFFFTLIPMNTSYANETHWEEIILANGFRAILVENRNAPVAASVVMVRTGSFREDFSASGMSHMLEHLLFNGTGKRIQKELYEEQDYYGIYNNAHTTREYTNYMVFSHKKHFDNALDIQSDMLLNSLIPEEKFHKEKGIVLNEIAMSRMRDDSLAEEQFNRKYFAGTPYNLPVLGLPETIKGMQRNGVFDFYKQYYVPNNMTAIVMGDFSIPEMKEKIERFFGGAYPGLLPEINSDPPALSHERFITPKKVEKVFIRMGMDAPSVLEDDFFPFYLLIQLASLDFKDRINAQLHAQGEKEVLDASIGMDYKKRGSHLDIHLDMAPGSEIPKTVAIVKKEIKGLMKREFSGKNRQGLLASIKMEEFSLLERPHYFGMIASAKIAAGGWDFAVEFIKKLEQISMKEMKNTAKKYFTAPSFLVSAIVPGGEGRDLTREARKEYFQRSSEAPSYTQESRDIVKAWKTTQEKYKSCELDIKKTEKTVTPPPPQEKETTKEILKNGLTLILKKSPTQGIFAVHVLIKNRSAMEPKGKEGIAELLHRLIDQRTASRTKEQLRDDLMSMGAKLKTADNPYIPYDNYYLSNEYSYIRLETTDEYYRQGVEVLADIIRSPDFDAKETEQEKNRLTALAKDKEKSASVLSQRLLMQSLFEQSGKEGSLYGNASSLKSISIKDLKEFHKKYFSPHNMIVSVVSGLETKNILEEIKLRFADMSGPVTQSPTKRKPRVPAKKEVREKLGKSQSYVRVAKVVEVSEEDKPVVDILSTLLSDHISFQLREKEGLSYSLWAGFTDKAGVTLLNGAMGTTPDKIKLAKNGLIREINSFKKAEIKQKDIERAVNQANSRRLMRTLTKIGQAYYLGLTLFHGKNPEDVKKTEEGEEKVTVEQVKAAAGKYLDTEGMLTVVVE